MASAFSTTSASSSTRASTKAQDPASPSMPPSPSSLQHPQSPAGLLSLAAVLDDDLTHSHTPLGEWLRSSNEDIHARLVHFSALPELNDPAPSFTHAQAYPQSCSLSIPRSLHSAAGSSMAPTCVHQSNASTHLPSLYNYSEATPTETSVSTDLVSRLPGVPLLEEVNGVLERPLNECRMPVYECTLWFLNCSFISTDMDEWKTHCLYHFRDRPPPKSISCPLCEFTYNDDEDNGRRAWEVRSNHIAIEHSQKGETLRTSRPDFPLFHHLWQQRLIGDQDLKELKGGNHNLTRQPENYTVTHGRRERDGRRQRLQGIGMRRVAA